MCVRVSRRRGEAGRGVTNSAKNVLEQTKQNEHIMARTKRGGELILLPIWRADKDLCLY